MSTFIYETDVSLFKRGEAFQKLDQQNELKFSVLILIKQEFRMG